MDQIGTLNISVLNHILVYLKINTFPRFKIFTRFLILKYQSDLNRTAEGAHYFNESTKAQIICIVHRIAALETEGWATEIVF